MPLKDTIVLLAAVVLSPPALAQPSGPVTQDTMNRDSASRLAVSERQMKSLVATLNARYPPPFRVALRRSQRAWEAYRDADCAFQASGVAGGSVQPLVLAECRADRTDVRVKDLKAQVDCQEGDMSCVKWAERR